MRSKLIAAALPDRGHVRILTPLYAGAMLLSALLLFWIQPLFTSMVLPHYGGAPAVWNTCLMFFQLMLLAGYCYVYFMARLPFQLQIVGHLTLLVAAATTLPISLNEHRYLPSSWPAPLSLLALLALNVGPAFFVLSATAPLLQRWFSYTRHSEAADPYFLYIASNVGSMLALAAYPILIERWLSSSYQTVLWAVAYSMLLATIVTCAALAWTSQQNGKPIYAPSSSGLKWSERAYCIVLAFVPSSLLLGVTEHLTSEIAAVPLLWVIPLLLYLATFVIVFARRPLLSNTWVVRVQPWFVTLLVLVWVLNTYLSVFLIHLATFFVIALMCHGELARRRPRVGHLTDFYLCIAVGGALGGIFNALIAPALFNTLVEYPLAIALACALKPVPAGTPWLRRSDFLVPLVLAAAIAIAIAFGFYPLKQGAISIVLYLEIVGVALYLCYERPVSLGLAVAVLLIGSNALHNPERVLDRHRSFYGQHTVLLDQTGKFHILMHGLTVHGAEYMDPTLRDQPTTYYHRDSPIGQWFRVAKDLPLQNVAVIGLGTGTLACYRRPGQQWTFYELDPTVVQLARNTQYFHFLQDCAPGARIVPGDGRLSLVDTPDDAYDLIIVDAFSSDSIPVHMITREAFALYMRKLHPDGVLMLHITNQYLDLRPVIGDLAADAGLVARTPGFHVSMPPPDRFAAMDSMWVAVARKPQPLQKLMDEEGWIALKPDTKRVWTDDYSNIFGALR